MGEARGNLIKHFYFSWIIGMGLGFVVFACELFLG